MERAKIKKATLGLTAVSLLLALGCGDTDEAETDTDAGPDAGEEHYPMDWCEVETANGPLTDIWATAPDNVYLGDMGSGHPNVIHFDGSLGVDEHPFEFSLYEFGSFMLSASPDWVHRVAVWGAAANDVYAASGQGEIVHFDGTDWQQVRPKSDFYADVVALDDGTAFAVGWDGIYEDTGDELSHIPDSPYSKFRVWAAGPDDIYSVGDFCNPYHFDGATWSQIDAGIDSDFGVCVVGGSGPDDVWIVGPSGWFHFDGTAWTEQPPDGPFYVDGLLSVWADSPSDVYAIGYDHDEFGYSPKVLHFDGGEWEQIASDIYTEWESLVPTSIWGSGADDVYLVTSTGRVDRKSADGWSTLSFTFDEAWLNDVWGSGPDDIHVVGRDGRAFHYDGEAWTAVETGSTDNLIAVDGRSDGTAIAVGEWGTVLDWDGSSWTPRNTVECRGIWSLWGSAADDIYAGCGSIGRALHYDGAVWSEVETGLPTGVLGLWGSGPNDLYAVGSYRDAIGAIQHFDGASWSAVDALSDAWLGGAIWGIDASAVFAPGVDGRVHRFDGTGWTYSSLGEEVDILGIWGYSADDLVAVGTDASMFHWDGTSWLPVELGIDPNLEAVFYDIDTVGDGIIFAVGRRVFLRHPCAD